MTSKRAIIFFWVLLLVPTMIIAGTAFTLLTHEQERINRSALAALEDRSAVIGKNIHTTMEALQKQLTRSLIDIRYSPSLLKTLRMWEQTNPLIRNVFIWKENERLVYPVQGMESTREERRFIHRYDALFSEQMPWQYSNNTLRTEKSGNLLELAMPKQQESSNSGWVPWFSENRLFILGWIRATDQGSVYGVELELMALLSRLLAILPIWNEQQATYAILNGNREIFHQSGPFPVDLRHSPAAVLPISPHLPHWQIHLYLNNGAVESRSSFMIMSGLLLSIFVISIVSGAALMTRQARIHRKDALQKTSFVSSVSHELKTPLTSIRMYAELLQSGRVKAPEKKQHYLNVIVAEGERLTRLVNNVLDFGRLEQGRKTYHKTRFDLGDFLKGIVDTHSIRLRESGMKVQMIIADMPMPVINDPDALEQVLLNIVDNAVKYASRGKSAAFTLMPPTQDLKEKQKCKNNSPKPRPLFPLFLLFPFFKTLFHSKKKNICVNETDYHYYDIKICDNGPGIAKGERKKIFDKFYRVDHTLTSRQPGSGLGLSIARKIARDLGGDLFLEIPPEGGCCFIVRAVSHFEKEQTIMNR